MCARFFCLEVVFINSKRIKPIIIDVIGYLIGAFIYSSAVTMFISPNEISPGGITGISTALNYLFGLPTGVVLLIINIPIIIIGFIKFGSIFIAKTAVATVLVSVTLEITEAVLPKFQVDKILASLFGGILMGAGMSIIMLRGATTGGVDIIAKLINSKYNHLTMGRIILISDAFVIALAAFVYKNIESALYSSLAIFASSYILDILLYGSDKGKIVYIVTNLPKELSEKITEGMRRGVSILDIVGGYTGEKRQMLMCVVRRSEVSALYKITKLTDPSAFVVVGEAGAVFGEGFKNIS